MWYRISVSEVRKSLQEIVDIKNNILKLCGQTENLETIESFFDLDKFKSTVETDENEDWEKYSGEIQSIFVLIDSNNKI